MCKAKTVKFTGEYEGGYLLPGLEKCFLNKNVTGTDNPKGKLTNEFDYTQIRISGVNLKEWKKIFTMSETNKELIYKQLL